MEKSKEAQPVEKQPVEPETKQRSIAAVRVELFQNTKASVLALLEQHKLKHGVEGIEAAAIAAAVHGFANWIGNNKGFAAGPNLPLLIQLGTEIIPKAAAEAEREAKARRIITL